MTRFDTTSLKSNFKVLLTFFLKFFFVSKLDFFELREAFLTKIWGVQVQTDCFRNLRNFLSYLLRNHVFQLGIGSEIYISVSKTVFFIPSSSGKLSAWKLERIKFMHVSFEKLQNFSSYLLINHVLQLKIGSEIIISSIKKSVFSIFAPKSCQAPKIDSHRSYIIYNLFLMKFKIRSMSLTQFSDQKC